MGYHSKKGKGRTNPVTPLVLDCTIPRQIFKDSAADSRCVITEKELHTENVLLESAGADMFLWQQSYSHHWKIMSW